MIGGLLLVLVTTALIKMGMPEWRLHMVLWGPLVAVIVPVAVSGLFSVYPAWRGAGLDPVAALRRS
jgi:ABC-type lipoprotein release transport system permease subunit